ncbi:MAG: Fur family transcriptional regulator [Candidatus Binataceae bacterium]
MDAVTVLRKRGIQPSAHRVAVAGYVLNSCDHPSAENVASEVRKTFPMISRATVYNTLNLLVDKGLLREFVLDDGKTVFDANMDHHHHFVDEQSGRVYDIPWESLRVSRLESLKGFEVKEYQVVVRGRVKGVSRRRA